MRVGVCVCIQTQKDKKKGEKQGEGQFHFRTIGQVAADPCPSHIPSWADMADLSP